ncbi:hypothetical protein J3A64_001342 [Pseudarthrobacter sp. PvP004]|nr:hypothetical protein [Pseudarthrobacter sp. PvP004]
MIRLYRSGPGALYDESVDMGEHLQAFMNLIKKA